jgi:hypothetical protein
LSPLIVLLSVLLACGTVSCQKNPAAKDEVEAAMEVQPGVFPTTGEAGGWVPVGEVHLFTGEGLFEHIDGGADIYFEYGFVKLVTRDYTEGKNAVSLEIYEMKNPSAAFGIYSYNRHPALSPIDVGGEGSIHSNGLLFWQDRYYVEVRQLGSGTIFSEDFLTLAKAVSNKIGATADEPAIMKLLPDENMVARTEVFATGPLGINNQVYVADEDLFGFKGSEAAAIARYRLREPEFSLIIAQYARDDACAEAFRRFREHFQGAESGEETQLAFSIMPGKHTAVRRVDDKLFVVANADSSENALTMLDRASGVSASNEL